MDGCYTVHIDTTHILADPGFCGVAVNIFFAMNDRQLICSAHGYTGKKIYVPTTYIPHQKK